MRLGRYKDVRNEFENISTCICARTPLLRCSVHSLLYAALSHTWPAFSFIDDWEGLEEEREGDFFSPFLTCSLEAFAIDLLLFKYLSGSFIYTLIIYSGSRRCSGGVSQLPLRY